MKVTLITNLEGLFKYRDTYDKFLAVGKFAPRNPNFVFEIEVDAEDILKDKPEMGWEPFAVYVKRRDIYEHMKNDL